MYRLNIYTYYYEYRSTYLELLNSNYKCINNFSGIKTSYIYETDLLSFSCIGSGTEVQSILINNALNIVQANNQFDICDSIHGHSILYSQYYQKYYIISDALCYNNHLPFFPLIGRITNITEDIEEEEENEGLKCIELEKCSKCDQESIAKNLCIKCNNENGYYLLKANYDTNLKYIDCVNDTTKPYNFYFDIEKKDYEPCFDTCFKCSKKGDYIENNCDSCDDITFIKKPE